MKLVFLSDDYPPTSFGGAGRVASQIAHGMAERGHEVTVISTTAGPKEERYQQDGYAVIRLPGHYHERWRAYRSIYNWKTVPKVAALLRSLRPDVVHAHNIHFYLSYGCLAVARTYSRHVFLTAHDALLFHYGKMTEGIQSDNRHQNYRITSLQLLRRFTWWYNPFRNILIRRAIKKLDTIFSISQVLRDTLFANGIHNVTLCLNGIRVEDWAQNEEEMARFRKKNNPQKKAVVLFGGRLSGAKGGVQILRAMQQVLRKAPHTVLLVLGKKDAFAERMLTLAHSLGIAEHTQFTGWLSGSELVAAFSSSTLVVVPSIYLDPFNITNIEAMASKKPVVGTCFGGTPEIVEDEKTGFIVNPLNTDELAEKILELIHDPKKAQRFGENGYARVREHFSLQQQLDTLESWYQR